MEVQRKIQNDRLFFEWTLLAIKNSQSTMQEGSQDSPIVY